MRFSEVAMQIFFNNRHIQVSDGLTLLELLNVHMQTNSKYAVALNHSIIPKIRYQDVVIKNDDVIDIIIPMQGG